MITTSNKTPTFICTRPRIASVLMDRGYRCEITSHPFRIGMTAWIFPMTVDLAEIVAAAYDADGRIPPKQITRFLNGEGGDLNV